MSSGTSPGAWSDSSRDAPMAMAEETSDAKEVSFVDFEALVKRDREAVNYSKSLLQEGDTLVYIKAPTNSQNYTLVSDIFLLDEPQRVHSTNLLATGSKIFEGLLGPTNQYRTLRRMKLVGRLPRGIKYVIDLTPPDEGDEAVDLIAELSCSPGVREWYRAEFRCEVSKNLVGGQEIVVSTRRQSADDKCGTNLPQSSPSTITKGIYLPKNLESTNRMSDEDQSFDIELKNAIMRSKIETRQVETLEVREIAEYCPFRHRAAIKFLLQLIEGKDFQRIDSAPKMWTIFILAKYFDCIFVVRDYIVTWLIAYPNTKFIEVLPEVTCQVGLGLQVPMITRAAFSILVSEEALSLVSRSQGKSNEQSRNINQFGRLREAIDEDLQTKLEYASKSFADRIGRKFRDLIDKTTPWFESLPEWQKIINFENAIFKSSHREASVWSHEAITLKKRLRHFVRGIILASILGMPLIHDLSDADNHRHEERYKSSFFCESFVEIYKRLSIEERVMTVFPWRALHRLENYTLFSNNRIFYIGMGSQIAKGYDIDQVHDHHLSNDQACLNRVILRAIEDKQFNDGIIPPEAIHDVSIINEQFPWLSVTDATVGSDGAAWRTMSLNGLLRIAHPESAPGTVSDYLASQKTEHTVEPPTIDPSIIEFKSEMDERKLKLPFRSAQVRDPEETSPLPFKDNRQVQYKHRAPEDVFIAPSSPFFSLANFLKEVACYTKAIAASLLEPSEMGFDIALTDTLLCLNNDEFKYLPLWAGGDDDGTGGVFDDSIPQAFAGPTGPGPAYHSGITLGSSSSSRTASSFSDVASTIDGESLRTSLGVEDGYSDHHDRRRIIVDNEDIHSEAFSEDSTDYKYRWKGKEVDRSGLNGSNYNNDETALSYAPSESTFADVESLASTATIDRAAAPTDTATVAGTESISDENPFTSADHVVDEYDDLMAISDDENNGDDSEMTDAGAKEDDDDDDSWMMENDDDENFDFGDESLGTRHRVEDSFMMMETPQGN